MTYQQSACPACSAPLIIEQNQAPITCPYCRTVLTKRRDGDDITLEVAKHLSAAVAQSGLVTAEHFQRSERRRVLLFHEERLDRLQREKRQIRRAPATPETAAQTKEIDQEIDRLTTQIKRERVRLAMNPAQRRELRHKLNELGDRLNAVRTKLKQLEKSGNRVPTAQLSKLQAEEKSLQEKYQTLDEQGWLPPDEPADSTKPKTGWDDEATSMAVVVLIALFILTLVILASSAAP